MLSEKVWQIIKTEVYFQVSRSQGSGGQSVNRTNSAALLRWNLAYSNALSPFQKNKLLNKLSLTREGEYLVSSQVHKSQEANKQECFDKLHETLLQALHVPKKRISTKPTLSSKRKRVESKKVHAAKKETRKKVNSGFRD